MIGIEAIGTYIPEKRIDNLARMQNFGVDEVFLRSKTGMLNLAVKDDEEDTSDLCVSAFSDLQSKVSFDMAEIDCLVVCTQNPDGHGLPHTSAIVHGKLGLPTSCAVFDISLGCSGFVYGLSVIQGFMLANGFQKGLLFTADPYSKIVDGKDKNTSLLFGDAATVSLISDAPRWKTGKFLFGSQGAENEAIKVQADSGKLDMNGRAVFSFTATVVPSHIRDMLRMNDLIVEDIDLFALHQGSRFIVDTLQKRLRLEAAKVPFVAENYGNTVSSSIPLILSALSGHERKIVISAFGVGLSWASTVLFNQGEK